MGTFTPLLRPPWRSLVLIEIASRSLESRPIEKPAPIDADRQSNSPRSPYTKIWQIQRWEFYSYTTFLAEILLRAVTVSAVCLIGVFM